MKRLAVILGVLALLFPGSALAASRTLRADGEAARWTSPRAYSAPYVKIDVRHNGKSLEQLAVSSCKAHYADKQVDVLVSTCGKPYRVRVRYVSFAGPERFRITYRPLR